MSGGGQLPSTGATVTTVHSSEQVVGTENAVFPALLKHTVNVDRAEFFGRRAGHSHQLDTVLVPLCF